MCCKTDTQAQAREAGTGTWGQLQRDSVIKVEFDKETH